jgi:hypothetical protein
MRTGSLLELPDLVWTLQWQALYAIEDSVSSHAFVCETRSRFDFETISIDGLMMDTTEAGLGIPVRDNGSHGHASESHDGIRAGEAVELASLIDSVINSMSLVKMCFRHLFQAIYFH